MRPTEHAPLVVGIGGTTRMGSSSERVLQLVLEMLRKEGARTEIFAGADLQMPMYSPDLLDRAPTAERLISSLRRCHGVVIVSPGYHGSVSGLVKNALDYTEDMRADSQPYLQGRAVGCITCAHGPQATVTTLLALRSVVHALRAWPTPMGVCVNTAEPIFAAPGALADPDLAARLKTLSSEVIQFARMREHLRMGADAELTA